MPAYDAGFKIVARNAGRELATLAGVRCDRWAPIVSEIQTTERLADRVFQGLRGRQRFVVYMEGYTTYQSAAPWSILSKSGLLSERERLPTISLLFILRRKGYRPHKGSFRLKVGRELTQFVAFREICLWKEEPQPWWEEVAGLMPLYPLSRHEKSGREAVAHAAEVIHRAEADVVVRADLLTTLAIFGKLAYPNLDAMGLIGREQMKESKVYQEIKEEGREEGRREGQLEAQRAFVLEALEARLGHDALAEFAPAVNTMNDPDRLAKLHRLVLRSRGMDDFRTQFGKL